MRSKQGSNGHSPDPSAPAIRPTTRTNLQRRGFLLTLGIGGAGAAVVAANKLATIAETPKPDAASADGKSYVLNDHIRRYYATTKV
jgi:hypothetical protein